MNGAPSLNHWVIAMVGGRCFIGPRVGGKFTADNPGATRMKLSPVYELSRGLIQGPQGQLAIQNAVMPVLMLSGVDSLDLPEAGTAIIPFSVLSDGEREAMAGGVKSAESMRSQMRAAESGIVVAGPGVKLPPPVRK